MNTFLGKPLGLWCQGPLDGVGSCSPVGHWGPAVRLTTLNLGGYLDHWGTWGAGIICEELMSIQTTLAKIGGYSTAPCPPLMPLSSTQRDIFILYKLCRQSSTLHYRKRPASTREGSRKSFRSRAGIIEYVNTTRWSNGTSTFNYFATEQEDGTTTRSTPSRTTYQYHEPK